MCIKKKFFTWDEAQMALIEAKIKQWKFNGHTRRRECRSYWCFECQAHHLTSNPGRPDQVAS
jgi:hypothetical protein